MPAHRVSGYDAGSEKAHSLQKNYLSKFAACALLSSAYHSLRCHIFVKHNTYHKTIHSHSSLFPHRLNERALAASFAVGLVPHVEARVQ